jgi:23S rRNA pseudouridine1911/1915/1917 synthase
MDEAQNPSAATADDEALDAVTDDAAERRECIVPAELHGVRIDKALVAMAPEFSRAHLQRLIDEGHVALDGKRVDAASRKAQAGQRLVVELAPTPESRAFRPEPMPLSIVHEDEHLMVVNKPAGLVVHPAAGNWSGTLLNGVLAHCPASAALPRAGIVHRLDKDTSGLMVLGKTLPAVTALVRAIAAREVHREYVAIAHGFVAPHPFSIEAPIGRDPQSRVRMAVTAHGREARTDVERLAATGEGTSAYSAVRCRLHTGRTHQIRVHLASRGNPLVADAVYGGRPALGLARQALHALRLGFVHPASGEAMQFHAAPPEDFTDGWLQVAGEAPPA